MLSGVISIMFFFIDVYAYTFASNNWLFSDLLEKAINQTAHCNDLFGYDAKIGLFNGTSMVISLTPGTVDIDSTDFDLEFVECLDKDQEIAGIAFTNLSFEEYTKARNGWIATDSGDPRIAGQTLIFSDEIMAHENEEIHLVKRYTNMYHHILKSYLIV